jgi:hypothetical protein
MDILDKYEEEQLDEPVETIEGEEPLLDDDGEDEITIGKPDELTEEQLAEKELHESNPMKTIRNELKKKSDENKRLRKELELIQQPITNQHVPDVIEKPTLERCAWDTAQYESELANWVLHQQHLQQRIIDEQVRVQEAQKGWAGLVDNYKSEKEKLKVKDFYVAEDEFVSAIDPDRQGIILKHFKEPAKIIYVLGKNLTKLDEIQKITDPIAFALAVRDIEKEITMTKRSSAPPPEKRVNTGTGAGVAMSAASDKHLERLRAEADASGDRSKVAAYLRSIQK